MNKYHNKKVEYRGIKFDSKKECAYYQQIELLQKAKVNPVTNISLQVPFVIDIEAFGKLHHICKYYADFVVTYADGHTEVVDTKGVKTDVYRLKKKLVEAIHNIKIIER